MHRRFLFVTALAISLVAGAALTANRPAEAAPAHLAPTANPVAWGCGFDDFGQCTVPELSGVTAIAAGAYHGLALCGDGTVAAWGCQRFANHGQCSVPSGLDGVTAIAGSFFHSLAVKGDGKVVAWGCFPYDIGQCGVLRALSEVTAVAAGRWHSLAIVAQ